jgi:hypothetical protein
LEIKLSKNPEKVHGALQGINPMSSKVKAPAMQKMDKPS